MTETNPDTLNGRYTGAIGAFFWLNFRLGLLTLITLGLYRFWARTRVRRYMWSATSPGGDPFEYTGTGLEKLLGFLVAMVVLAVVLGIMQLLLFYAGMSVFSGYANEAELQVQIAIAQLSLLVLYPLILFARYRARRYIMARTRWRGLRFGMESEAFGYMWRGLAHGLLSVLTLGILVPRQTYYLTKFMVDRTWYGDHQLRVGGRWQMLYPAMKHILFGVVLIVAGFAVIAAGAAAETPAVMVAGGAAIAVGYVWLIVGFIFYKVRTFELMADATGLGETVTFRAGPRTRTVVKHIFLGGLLASVILGLAGAAYTTMLAGVGFNSLDANGLPNFGPSEIAVLVIGGLLLLALWGALSKALIIQPIVSHVVTNTWVATPMGLAAVRQREADEMVDADGFADALDVGGAI